MQMEISEFVDDAEDEINSFLRAEVWSAAEPVNICGRIPNRRRHDTLEQHLASLRRNKLKPALDRFSRQVLGGSAITEQQHHVERNDPTVLQKTFSEPMDNNLPCRLMDCFVYLGMFPEDYEIPVWTLTRLWIAEGFFRVRDGEEQGRLEEIAEQNLYHLINQNLVIVDKKNLEGNVKTCHIHKFTRQFCISKAAEQNLFREVKLMPGKGFEPSPYIMQKCRRLCIHSHLSKFLHSKPSGPVARSFLCFDKEPVVLDPTSSAIPEFMNLLRVLECKSIKLAELPEKLTKLMHLRYVSLCCDGLDILPETISELWNLQTLVVQTLSPSLVVKTNIWSMFCLRHLLTNAAIFLAIQEKGKAEGGQELQTMSRLSPEHCTKAVFERAPNLKRLGIRGKLATLSDPECLRKLEQLERLKLVDDDRDSESASNNHELHRHLQPNCFPPRLRRLTLSGMYLDWQHMSLLGKIDTLEVLKLKNNAFTGESWNIDGDGFPRLQFFSIQKTDLVSWEASSDCFPGLKRLQLKNCEKLRNIPLSLTESLEVLDIDGVPKSAVESARKIEEEKVRMQGQHTGRCDEFKLYVGPRCK